MAACASAWEEYFTKAHPGGTGEAEPRRRGPEEGQRSARTERWGTGGTEGRGRLPEESRVRHRKSEREPTNSEQHKEAEKDRDRPESSKDP